MTGSFRGGESWDSAKCVVPLCGNDVAVSGERCLRCERRLREAGRRKGDKPRTRKGITFEQLVALVFVIGGILAALVGWKWDSVKALFQ